MADEEKRGEASISVVEGIRILERLLTILLVPIVTWMFVTILSHEAFVNRVEANRFTATDGLEMSITIEQGFNALRLSVQSLQDQHDELERRLLTIESGR